MIEDFNKVKDLLDSPDQECVILGKEIIKLQYPEIFAWVNLNRENTIRDHTIFENSLIRTLIFNKYYKRI